MTAAAIVILCCLIAAVAIAYSAVGQAGATGYLAVMALAGVAPDVMKPTALLLNLIVAAVSTWQLQAERIIRWRALTPLIVASVPAAFVGGAIQLPDLWFRYLVGMILVLAGVLAFRSALRPMHIAEARAARAARGLGPLLVGAVVGLLSGLTGTGGGVFLAPVAIALAWTNARTTAAITAPFNLVNSLAALAGNVVALRALPAELPYFGAAALLGAVVGTHLGMRWLSLRALHLIMSLVLLAAGTKFLLA